MAYDYEALLSKVQTRKKAFESGWWANAKKAAELYDVGKREEDQRAFNILYANTEILLPSLFSSTPRPDVTARTAQGGPAAQAASRMMAYLLDDNVTAGESFYDAMEGATLSGLVPGAGGVRLRVYPGSRQPLQWEEYKYNQLVWAAARKWSRVSWIAFIHPMMPDEIIDTFKLSGEKKAKLKAKEAENDEAQKPEPIYVYEVWNKRTKKICFLCEEYEGALLQEDDDTLGLAGFYPTPGPLLLVRKPNNLDPTPLYCFYENQAEELNRVTVRLNKVLSAIRVRGAHHPQLAATLQAIMDEGNGENFLVPAAVPLDMSQGGFDKYIWLMPLEKLAQVAQQLYAARQEILQVIYQLTGLSDIIRGSSVASESATAQNIKTQWGSARLRRMQVMVSTYARSLLRIGVTVAARVLPPEMWTRVAEVQLPTREQKQQAVLAYQQQAMLAEQQGQQPPPPPPVLQQPAIEDVLAQLGDEYQRGVVIDIETNSTIDSDAQIDKQEVIDFLPAVGQVMQAAGPLMQVGPSGYEAMKTLLLAVFKRFKLGREVEKAFAAIQAPQPQQQGEDPKVAADRAKAQAEIEAFKRKQELDAQRHVAEMQKLTRQAELDAMRFENEKRSLMLDAQRLALQAVMPPPAPTSSPRRPARA